MTFHLGDIKNGSSRCDDAYYRVIKENFDRGPPFTPPASDRTGRSS